MKKFTSERAGRFFDVTRRIVESEIRSGDTISLVHDVDLSQVESFRSHVPRANRPSYTAFVVKALALALREYPYANRRLYRTWGLPFLPARLQTFGTSDVAVACERSAAGLPPVAMFADVLRNADQLSLGEITEWLRKLSTADRDNNKQWRDFIDLIEKFPSWLSTALIQLPLRLPQLWQRYRGGAALVSAPTKYGADLLLGCWTSPLGVSFGFVRERPMVHEGKVVARPTFKFLLNFDRRIMAGAQAARFFARMVFLLEHAEETLLEREDCELLCGKPGQVRPPAPSCSLGSAHTGAERTTHSEAC